MAQEQSKNKNSIYVPEWEWLGRSLTNYKDMHTSTAKEKGVEKEFQSAKTLTAARKILFGFKKKNTR